MLLKNTRRFQHVAPLPLSGIKARMKQRSLFVLIFFFFSETFLWRKAASVRFPVQHFITVIANGSFLFLCHLLLGGHINSEPISSQSRQSEILSLPNAHLASQRRLITDTDSDLSTLVHQSDGIKPLAASSPGSKVFQRLTLQRVERRASETMEPQRFVFAEMILFHLSEGTSKRRKGGEGAWRGVVAGRKSTKP